MFQIIKPEDRAANEDLLDEMFRHRYSIVVQEWGWDVPGVKAPFETDQFDTDDTVYVVVRDPDLGRITASSRLNPTVMPHMLSEVFPEFCNLQPYPIALSTWEWTRLVVDRKAYKSNRATELKIRSSLSLGIHKFCREHGIDELSFLTHQFAYQLVQKVWDTEPLGLPIRAPGEDTAWIAAKSRVDAAAYEQLTYRHENAEAIIARQVADFTSIKRPEAA